jgi:hypothetical protein
MNNTHRTELIKIVAALEPELDRLSVLADEVADELTDRDFDDDTDALIYSEEIRRMTDSLGDCLHEDVAQDAASWLIIND